MCWGNLMNGAALAGAAMLAAGAANAGVVVKASGPSAGQYPVGKKLDDASVSAASATAGEGMDFLGDIFASEEYRAHLVKVYAKRAVLAAAEAAK